ncbi:ATP-binding protein [Mucilaginibacter sp. BT774]|uniref:sensor histidine kinase n=1 Tax=Mucilaginibacter sp. BT774 TaxID=3062276 RepID=UPI0026762770|nr:ATP-binding protein [Mucilaginibacter sp. BT774]MDO3624736.1 ATP-binding protein [Mucilaginibacter sp. BT774]
MVKKNNQIKTLEKLNDDLENYFSNTIIPQLFVDSDMILRKFTPPAMKQFSLKPEYVGKPIGEVQENFRFPTIIENIQQVIETRTILEKEIQTTDYRWFQMNILPYVIKNTKKTNGVIITFVDITLRIKDLKDLEKLISEHETLLDAISHDIKGPLTSLMLTINQMKKVSLENQQGGQSLFKILESAISKMQVIISDLVDSRKQEHKYKSEEELLNFEHIIEDVRLTLTGDLSGTRVALKNNINVSEILFSRRKLRSIIYNLVSNAIKFRSNTRDPEVIISTKREGDLIIISVKDNGIGIPTGKQDAIFSKYFRVENDIEGSGIGLYLVKEIVNNAGGSVSVSSEEDAGSEFTVKLKCV